MRPSALLRPVNAFILAAILAACVCGALLSFFGAGAWPEIVTGWCGAAVNGAAHSWICAGAVGAQPGAFLRRGIITNALRIVVVLATLTVVCFFSRLQPAPLALSLAAGTVVFLVFNAAAMAVDSGRKDA